MKADGGEPHSSHNALEVVADGMGHQMTAQLIGER